jgi:hypothetical protein
VQIIAKVHNGVKQLAAAAARVALSPSVVVPSAGGALAVVRLCVAVRGKCVDAVVARVLCLARLAVLLEDIRPGRIQKRL